MMPRWAIIGVCWIASLVVLPLPTVLTDAYLTHRVKPDPDGILVVAIFYAFSLIWACLPWIGYKAPKKGR